MMKVKVVFLFLSFAFATAVLGAAITTTKSVATKQASKSFLPSPRHAG